MTKKLCALLLAVVFVLTLCTGAFASDEFSDYEGGSTLSMGDSSSESSSSVTTVLTVDDGYTLSDADDSVYTITVQPTITVEDDAIVIDGIEMNISDFTANGLTVAGSDDVVILRNAVVTKLVTSEITGTAGGYIAGTTGGTLYIQNSILTEDGRGGVNGNYTVYASGSGVLVVENSSIIQLGEDEEGYTSSIGEPGSNGGLLVYGTARANMSIGKSHTYYFYSYVETEGWAAMSTDAGNGVMFYSYCSTARAINGGYGIYADNGCYDYIYGTTLLAAEMGAIIAGGGEIHIYGSDSADETITDMMDITEPTEGVRSLVVANRTGIMIHSPDESHSGDNGNSTASIFSASETDFVMTDDMNAYWEINEYYDGETWEPDYQDYAEKYDVAVGEYIEFIRGAAILVKSTSATIDLDDVTFTLENGTYGANAIIMTVINSDENGRWVQSGQAIENIQGTVANISNSTISGDFKNYDYQRKLTVNFDAVEWTGASYTWDAETFNSIWSEECLAADRCLWILDSDSYITDTTMGTYLTFANGSVWNVTDESVLAYLAWDDTCTINGTVTVDGVVVTEPGEYEGEIVVSPAASDEASGETEDGYVITVDGVTGTALYTEGCFIITFNGEEIYGNISQGVWNSATGDAADIAIIEAFQAVFEAENAIGAGSTPKSADCEITVDGVTGTASYQDLGFCISFNGRDVYGSVTTGVWGASSGTDEDQAVVDAFEAVYVSANNMGDKA